MTTSDDQFTERDATQRDRVPIIVHDEPHPDITIKATLEAEGDSACTYRRGDAHLDTLDEQSPVANDSSDERTGDVPDDDDQTTQVGDTVRSCRSYSIRGP